MHRLKKELFDLSPSLRGHELLDHLTVLKRLPHHPLQRLIKGGGGQTAGDGLVENLLILPLNHVHNIPKVIVEGLAADGAVCHQLFYGDFVQLLVLEQIGQGLRDL